MSDAPVPVTKIRLQIPRGTPVEDVISRLEITFEQSDALTEHFNVNVCCVDASLVSPVSTIADNPSGGDAVA